MEPIVSFPPLQAVTGLAAVAERKSPRETLPAEPALEIVPFSASS
jgi:hypothetical protein